MYLYDERVRQAYSEKYGKEAPKEGTFQRMEVISRRAERLQRKTDNRDLPKTEAGKRRREQLIKDYREYASYLLKCENNLNHIRNQMSKAE